MQHADSSGGGDVHVDELWAGIRTDDGSQCPAILNSLGAFEAAHADIGIPLETAPGSYVIKTGVSPLENEGRGFPTTEPFTSAE